MDLFGEAIRDYYNGKYSEDLITFISLGVEDKLPLPYLFRKYDQMPGLEQQALELCRGKILDIGCGAGSHSIFLKEKGFDITAIDTSEGAVDITKKRGIDRAIVQDVRDYSGQKYDTLLLLMNGIGMAGRIKHLGSYLNHLKSLLHPEGQILTDSTDIIYMFEDEEDGGYTIPGHLDYYGEVDFRLSYKNQLGEPFPWFYIGFELLKEIAEDQGFECNLIGLGEHFDYLAQLILKR